MKKHSTTLISLLILALFAGFGSIKAQNIDSWLISEQFRIIKPAFDTVKNIKEKTFEEKDLLSNDFIEINNIRPFISKSMQMGKSGGLSWKKISTADSSGILLSHDSNKWHIQYLASYFYSPEFTKTTIEAESHFMLEAYVDGEKIFSKNSCEADTLDAGSKSKELKLMQGKHLLLIKLLLPEGRKESKLRASAESDAQLEISLNPESYMDIEHLMNGKNVQNISISPKGDYYYISYSETYPPEGKSKSWSEIRKTATNELVEAFITDTPSSTNWIPKSNTFSFVQKSGEEHHLMAFDPEWQSYKKLATGSDEIYGYNWSPNGDFIIFSSSDKADENKSGLKKLEGMPDHWPWWRNRYQLNILFIENGMQQRLTHGNLSAGLQDISPDGTKILFSTSSPDFTQRPYSVQKLYEMTLSTGELKEIWTKNYSGSVQYSPDGTKLLVSGSPVLFGDLGKNLSKKQIPNDYDTQAYIYDLGSGEATAISKDFKPNIQRAYWKEFGIVFLVEEESYDRVYTYDINSKEYTRQNIDADVVTRISVSNKGQLACIANSISTPPSAFTGQLDTDNFQRISAPWEEEYQFVKFGKTEDWNFKNKKGVEIKGRVYYPPNFDAAKKYPVIVYYYGGTSPVNRSFGGRYPKNLFAAMGYLVYVLQPSGATGFGQEFSAMHVNNWGITVADEIIKGTKEFLAAHPFADAKKVGCMGASYGGFMTMLLQTRTDIFAAAIAHAGISSIASYWGEGYWGYLYSSTATANSFPWNNKELYVEQSPLYHADKIHTPLLLLHGNSDTNVPPGESRQLYAALKLLNRPVELIEIDKQDHHIADYKKRILWQKTILAWFDRYLKGESQWWDELYPENQY